MTSAAESPMILANILLSSISTTKKTATRIRFSVTMAVLYVIVLFRTPEIIRHGLKMLIIADERLLAPSPDTIPFLYAA